MDLPQRPAPSREGTGRFAATGRVGHGGAPGDVAYLRITVSVPAWSKP